MTGTNPVPINPFLRASKVFLDDEPWRQSFQKYMSSRENRSVMSEQEKYPKRAEYGPTTSRCRWCGRDDTHFWGMYCSRQCAFAGHYYTWLCATLIAILFTVWALMELYPLGVIFFGGLSAILLYYMLVATKMRRRTN
jgi:ribosomal protein S14